MTDPTETELLRLQDGLARRDRALVNEASAALIEQRAALGSRWHAIATALMHNGEIVLALKAIDALVESARGSPLSRFLRAGLLAQAGRLGEARAALEAVPANVPDPVAHAFLRGTIALNLGEREEARGSLESCVEQRPSAGQAWLALAELTDFCSDRKLADDLASAFAAGAQVQEDRVGLAYATGAMRHQLGDHEGAFRAFSAGAEAKREQLGPAARVDLQAAARSSSWSRAQIDRVASSITVDHDRPIFVTGLPRSGTTLVEQVLVSHSEVTAGQELNLFQHLGREVGGLDGASFESWLDRGGDPNGLVELYLHLATERFGPAGKFVDKTVEAGNYMGLLLALFPKAPVFWMHRDPIDNGWSAFRTAFAAGAGWSWRLEDVGLRLAQEERMIAYWFETAGDRIAFVDYETLVRDPEAQIPRIAAAAGLDLEPQMLRPHETERTVATASVSQVREPINLKGVGVAEPYRAWLGPMIEAYESQSVSEGSSIPS